MTDEDDRLQVGACWSCDASRLACDASTLAQERVCCPGCNHGQVPELGASSEDW
jgi:hypothetical protein